MLPQPVSSDFYKGKTAAFFGDSITAGVGASAPEKRYVNVLARKLGLKDFHNAGSSGTTLTEGTASPTGGCFPYFTDENCRGADLVTIKLGINDFDVCLEGVHTIGQFLEDSHETVYGALRRWCEKVVELRSLPTYRNTKFFFITPVPGGWNCSVDAAGRNLYNQNKRNINGWTLRDYCEAMLKTCAHYQIPVLDLNRYGSIYYKNADDNNMAENFDDGLHPNDSGHGLIAENLYQLLLMNPTCAEGDAPYIAPEFAHKLVDRLMCKVTYCNSGIGGQPQCISTYRLPESLPVLSADGYRFDGWFTDKAFTYEAKPNDVLASDITLYAKWTKI